MKTWEIVDKNSDAVLILSAETEDEVRERMTEILKDTYGWRVECVDENEDGDADE